MKQIKSDKIIVLLKQNYSIWILCFCMVILCMAKLSKYTTDHVWIYQYKMALQGKVPYRDFNTFVPPVFIYLASFLMLPFSSVCAVNFAGVVLFVISAAFLYLKKDRQFLFLLQLAISLLNTSLEYNYAEYLYFLLILLFIKKCSKIKNTNAVCQLGIAALIAALSFFAVLTKISFGLMIAGSAYLTLCMETLSVKKDRKKRILKITSVFALVFLFLSCILAGVFYLQKALPDFIDQCMMPLLSHATAYSQYSHITFWLLAIAALILFFTTLYKRWKMSIPSSVLFCFLCVCAGFINLIPSYNGYHYLILLSIFLALVTEIYQNDKTFFKKEIIPILILSAVIIYSVHNTAKAESTYDEYTQVMDSHTGKEVLFLHADMIKPAIEYVMLHPDTLYVSGENASASYLADIPYEKYAYLLIDGNIGTKDPADILENSHYRYFIYPANDSKTSYDRLLDRRIEKYINTKTVIDTILVNDKVIYYVYKK